MHKFFTKIDNFFVLSKNSQNGKNISLSEFEKYEVSDQMSYVTSLANVTMVPFVKHSQRISNLSSLFLLRLPVCLQVLVAEPPPPPSLPVSSFLSSHFPLRVNVWPPHQCLTASYILLCSPFSVSECSPHLRMRDVFFLLALLVVAPLASAYWGHFHLSFQPNHC